MEPEMSVSKQKTPNLQTEFHIYRNRILSKNKQSINLIILLYLLGVNKEDFHNLILNYLIRN